VEKILKLFLTIADVLHLISLLSAGCVTHFLFLLREISLRGLIIIIELLLVVQLVVGRLLIRLTSVFTKTTEIAFL
jgi:hypothetical protein